MSPRMGLGERRSRASGSVQRLGDDRRRDAQLSGDVGGAAACGDELGDRPGSNIGQAADDLERLEAELLGSQSASKRGHLGQPGQVPARIHTPQYSP